MNTRAGKTKGLLTNVRGRLGGPHSTRWGGTGRLRKLVPALPWIALAALALLALAAVTLLPPLISPDLDDPHAQFEVRNEAFRTVAAIIGGIVVVAGVFINWRRVSQLERQVNAAELGQITERFTRAIDQLGAVRPNGEPAPEIRAGGVRSLERIARESDEDFWPVLDILTAYLRSELGVSDPEHFDVLEEQLYEARDRMDLAFTVEAVGRLWPGKGETVQVPLNLAYTFVPRLTLRATNLIEANLLGAMLRSADFSGANLQSVDLRSADLRGAWFRDAHLRGARLTGAALSGAQLWNANLSIADLRGPVLDNAILAGAILRTANLEDANLRAASLQETDLRGASLGGANLRGANLHEADLREADLREADLAGASLEGIVYDQGTKWPDGFVPPTAAG